MQIHNKPELKTNLSLNRKKQAPSSSSLPVTESTSSSFLEILESIVPSTQEETKHLNDLWRTLPDLEKALIQNQTKDNLEKYKSHIKEIAEIVLKGNYKVVQAPLRGKNPSKDLRYVKVLDEKLNLLASTMFSNTNSAFAILKQFEDIRGILIDLKG